MAKIKDCKAANKATKPTHKRTPRPKTPEELLERLSEMANDSSRHFIALLASAILTLPNIKERSQDAADNKGNRILDNLYAAFVKAQVDACKFSQVSLLNQITSK